MEWFAQHGAVPTTRGCGRLGPSVRLIWEQQNGGSTLLPRIQVLLRGATQGGGGAKAWDEGTKKHTRARQRRDANAWQPSMTGLWFATRIEGMSTYIDTCIHKRKHGHTFETHKGAEVHTALPSTQSHTLAPRLVLSQQLALLPHRGHRLPSPVILAPLAPRPVGGRWVCVVGGVVVGDIGGAEPAELVRIRCS